MHIFSLLHPSEDAYVSQYYANTNFGAEPYLYTNRYNGINDEYQTLLQFNNDFNSYCRSWRLRLKIYRNEVPSATTLFVHRVLGNWNEMNITWNTRPAIDAVPIGSAIVQKGDFNWVEIDLNGFDMSLIHHNLLLKCDVPENSLLGFYSREYQDPSLWPQLVAAPVSNLEKPTVKVSGPMVTLPSDLVRIESDFILSDEFIPFCPRRLFP